MFFEGIYFSACFKGFGDLGGFGGVLEEHVCSG